LRLRLATASDVVGNKIKEGGGGKKSKPVQLYTPLNENTLYSN
jgi:hypothetical protein